MTRRSILASPLCAWLSPLVALLPWRCEPVNYIADADDYPLLRGDRKGWSESYPRTSLNQQIISGAPFYVGPMGLDWLDEQAVDAAPPA